MLVTLLAVGCGPALPAPSRPESAEPPSGPASYPLRGQIVSIDRSTGRVVIRHEEIPNYMPAMTMPFDLSGDPTLEELEPGDRIEATLRIHQDKSALDNIVITELSQPVDPSPPAAAALESGDSVPDFLMTSQEGVSLRLSELRGKAVALTFIYTRCPLPEFCPLMDRRFAELAGRIRSVPGLADSVRLLSVSFDPEHDRPPVLRQHARIVGAQPPLWSFAVADHEELARVAAALGLTYGPAPGELIHSLSTAVIDPAGRLVALHRGNRWTVESVFRQLRDAARSAPKAERPPLATRP